MLNGLLKSVNAFLLFGYFLIVTSLHASADEETKGHTASGETRNQYAILVGVTEYTQQDVKDLVGPRNDVLLMRQVLADAGFSEKNLHLLVDDVPGAEEPTRENIMNAISTVTEKVEAGDQIYLHFGGHGTQVPMLEGAGNLERDGLDELFLPKDIKGWTRESPAIDRAIRDNEIAVIVSELRQKGAFVWIVFDSCHSGTMTRGVVTMRSAKPSHLGIPPEVMSAARATVQTRGESTEGPDQGMLEMEGQELSDDNPEKGGLVAFYAAQTDQETPEFPLPRRTEGAKQHGLFSYNIATTLANNSGLTYRQLAEQILQNYQQQPWRRSVPLFEGDSLDREVFGDAVMGMRQYKVNASSDEVKIDGGLLHQLAPGTRLAIVPSPTAPQEKIIALAEVVSSDTFKSEIRLLPLSGFEEPVKADDLPATAYARIVEDAFRIDVTYSVETLEYLSESESEQVTKALETLQNKDSDDGSQLAVRAVGPDQGPDIRLLGAKGELYFLADDEDYPCVKALRDCPTSEVARKFIKTGIAQPEELSKEIERVLLAIGRANNLRRLAGFLGAPPQDIGAVASYTPMATRGATDCNFGRGVPDASVEFPRLQVPSLRDGNCLSLRFQNNGNGDVDMHVLFIDSNYGVHSIFPQEGMNNRIKSGEEEFWHGRVSAENTIGREQILVITVKATHGSATADFGFLAQKPLERSVQTRSATGETARGGPFGSLEEVFGRAAFGGVQTRDLTSSVPPKPVELSGVQLISWETVPR